MFLAQEQDVIDLIGQSQRVGNTSTAKDNLRHATSQIENHLGTSFARTERVDYFGCPTNVGNGTPAYILNLTQGFIDLGQDFEVFYSDDGGQILDIADANAVLQEPEAYALDENLGRLTLFGTTAVPTDIPFRSIAIHYTAGFETDDHDVAQGVPDAIQAGAASVAVNNMRGHSSMHTNKQPYADMQGSLRRLATGILSAYIRPRVTGDETQYRETI